ncbi:MAG: type VI secretion system domain-containing protein [Janthinobacterium lividum]
MPLHADLLRPIPGEAPAGVDLAYDKLYDQIKEARQEDDESLPAGSWTRAPKKADRSLILRVAGEALATRSKDLRLAGWYFESLLRREGFPQFTPILEALRALQEQFWGGLYPLAEEDGDLGRRTGALEGVAAQLAAQLKLLSLTRSGIDYVQAQGARSLGYEADATTKERKELREDAANRGRVLLEELDKAIAETPKAFYAETEAALGSAATALQELEDFHVEHYLDEPPSFSRLKSAMEDVAKFVGGVMAEKRKLEPDPEATDVATEAPDNTNDPFARFDASPMTAEASELAESADSAHQPIEDLQASEPSMQRGAAEAFVALPGRMGSEPVSREEALSQVAEAVRFLSRKGASLETAYALAAAPGIALLFRAGPDFAWPAPAAGVRQGLRKLAREESWAALELGGLEALAATPETIWLDLHRYIWQAAAELGHRPLAAMVLGTVRGCLQQLPDLDKALLDDDTPSASMETQSWLRALHPHGTEDGDGTAGKASAAMLVSFVQTSMGGNGHGNSHGSSKADAFAQALALLKGGRLPEAIGLLSRDAEEQPSGRLRFERRLQTAELCLQAGHAAVAQPLLADLTAELERRTLEGWESASLLAKPLALMIRCLDLGTSSADNRAALFARLCRLDPVAAAALDRAPSGSAG